MGTLCVRLLKTHNFFPAICLIYVLDYPNVDTYSANHVYKIGSAQPWLSS
jgi:hypothetical protein